MERSYIKRESAVDKKMISNTWQENMRVGVVNIHGSTLRMIVRY